MTEDEYIAAQKASGLQVGDAVLITRTVEEGENGWVNSWADGMDRTVGQIGKIRFIHPGNIVVDFVDDWWNYPFFVLKKVNLSDKADAETFANLMNV